VENRSQRARAALLEAMYHGPLNAVKQRFLPEKQKSRSIGAALVIKVKRTLFWTI
jgi:hypothetical protein